MLRPLRSLPALGLAPLLCLLGLVGPLGCTAVLGIEDTQLATEDAGPPPAGQDYGCVGQARPAPSKATITLTVAVTDLNKKALEGITVKVCTRFDTQCLAAESFLTGKDGKVAIPEPTGTSGFDGSLEISGDDGQGHPFLPVRWFFPNPLIDDLSLPLLMISEDIFKAIAPAQVKYDGNAGQLTLAIADCQGQPSSGVTYAVTGLDDQSVETYSKSSAFVVKDAQSATDKSGQAIVFNVPPGNVTVTTTNEKKQQVASFGLTIQAGKISTVILQPNL